MDLFDAGNEKEIRNSSTVECGADVLFSTVWVRREALVSIDVFERWGRKMTKRCGTSKSYCVSSGITVVCRECQASQQLECMRVFTTMCVFVISDSCIERGEWGGGWLQFIFLWLWKKGACACMRLAQWADSSVSDITTLRLTYLKWP